MQANELISSLQHYIDTSKENLEAGNFIDLVDMKDQVKDICTAISEMELDEAKEHQQALEQIAKDLDYLKEQMEHQRDALRDELGSTTRHHHAAKAYKQSESNQPAPLPEAPSEDE